MSNIRLLALVALLGMVPVGTATAQQGTGSPGASGTPTGAEGQKVETGKEMTGGERGGGSGNTGVPGGSPAADGNKTQDSRTTKTRDR
jgi:hypothetical protein